MSILDNLTDTEPLYDAPNPTGFSDLVIGFANTVSDGLWAHGIIFIVFVVPFGSFLAKGFDTRTAYLTGTFGAWMIAGPMWVAGYIGDYAVSFVTVAMFLGIGLAYAGGRKV